MSEPELTPEQRRARARSFDEMVSSHWSLVASVRRFSMLVVAALVMNTAILIIGAVLSFHDAEARASLVRRVDGLETQCNGSR